MAAELEQVCGRGIYVWLPFFCALSHLYNELGLSFDSPAIPSPVLSFSSIPLFFLYVLGFCVREDTVKVIAPRAVILVNVSFCPSRIVSSWREGWHLMPSSVLRELSTEQKEALCKYIHEYRQWSGGFKSREKILNLICKMGE